MFNILTRLAAQHEVHLVSVALAPVHPSELKAIKPYCRSLHLVYHPDTRLRRTLRIVASLFTGRPYLTFKHTPRALGDLVETLVSTIRPGIILVEFHYSSDCIRTVTNIPRVVEMHNLDHLLYRRFAENTRWSAKKIHGWLQYPMMRRYESDIPHRFDRCVMMSEDEARLLKKLSGETKKISVVANGVDLEFFQPDSPAGPNYDLIFTGSMDYYPNVDAALFIGHQIMPGVWKSRPQTTLAIVGRNPIRQVQRLGADSRIDVLGEVADIRPHLAGASIALVTLRMGSGTRLKALEAAAMSKAIVGTPIGLEGLHFENGLHAFIAEKAADLTAGIVELLGDPQRIERMGQSARALVANQYSWQTSAAKLAAILEETHLEWVEQVP